MGVKPAHGTGGRALPAGRGWGLSALGEGSAAQGSELGGHWCLNPVIPARQLRGPGARDGEALPGVSLLCGEPDALSLSGSVRPGRSLGRNGLESPGLSPRHPSSPAPASPSAWAPTGRRQSQRRGVWTRGLMWICGGKKVPPHTPNPSSVQTHLLSPGFLGLGGLASLFPHPRSSALVPLRWPFPPRFLHP